MKKILLFNLILLSFLFTSQAWNGRGHMLIASIAYSELSQTERDSALALLKYHPAYEKEWVPGYKSWENDVDFGTYIFMQASLWADEIKWRGNPKHRYNNSEWHYITYKVFTVDSVDTFVLGNKKEPDVVWAIENAQKIVNDKSQKLKKRAIYFSWLLHLVGDVHQPMHTASTFNEIYPEGDKGGNRIYFKFGRSSKNLHSLWDRALGESKQYKPIVEYANEIKSNNNIPTYIFQNNAKAWSIESFKLAIKDAHLNLTLQGSINYESDISLPDGYIKNMKTVSEKQVYIAGLRLKGIIEALVLSY